MAIATVPDALRAVATRFAEGKDSQPSESLDILNVLGDVSDSLFIRALPLVQEIEGRTGSRAEAVRLLGRYADGEEA